MTIKGNALGMIAAKLVRLGIPDQIVDYGSDSEVKIGRRLNDNLDSDNEIRIGLNGNIDF